MKTSQSLKWRPLKYLEMPALGSLRGNICVVLAVYLHHRIFGEVDDNNDFYPPVYLCLIQMVANREDHRSLGESRQATLKIYC